MKKHLWLAAIIIFSLWGGAIGILFAASAEPVQAGVAAAVKGQVTTLPEGAPQRDLKSGDKVFLGDTIETGTEGHLQVLLLDSTIFTLGPLSALKVDEFVYDPATDDGKVKASMVKGIFRVVSGKVAHKKPENMNVDLPVGSIGFRGTMVGGIIEGMKSLVVLLGPVKAGAIYVSNIVNGKSVGVDINQSGFGTVIGGPDIAPLAAFRVPDADLNRIAQGIGQSITPGAKVQTTGKETTSARMKAAANARAAEDLLADVDKMDRTSTQAAQDKRESSSSSSSSYH